MTTKLGINGLGRIGRCVLRAWADGARDDVEIVAVNARGACQNIIHLVKYDSTHGVYEGGVSGDDNSLTINGRTVQRFAEDNPADIPWEKAGVDVVLECTGKFKSHAEASQHLGNAVKKVLISAPSDDADAMIVYGVNNEVLKDSDTIISVGSCTTNCLAPVAKVLHEAIGIEAGFMTTIHAYTNDQRILDGSHKDLRRARTAGASMIPTSTGAAKAIGKVLPELDGKLDGTSIRVPTPNISLVDLTFTAAKDTSVEEINSSVEKMARGELKGVLGVNSAPLVSIDFLGDPHSSVFDLTQTQVINKRFCRVASWYDNEWGFSVRMLDVAALMNRH